MAGCTQPHFFRPSGFYLVPNSSLSHSSFTPTWVLSFLLSKYSRSPVLCSFICSSSHSIRDLTYQGSLEYRFNIIRFLESLRAEPSCFLQACKHDCYTK